MDFGRRLYAVQIYVLLTYLYLLAFRLICSFGDVSCLLEGSTTLVVATHSVVLNDTVSDTPSGGPTRLPCIILGGLCVVYCYKSWRKPKIGPLDAESWP